MSRGSDGVTAAADALLHRLNESVAAAECAVSAHAAPTATDSSSYTMPPAQTSYPSVQAVLPDAAGAVGTARVSLAGATERPVDEALVDEALAAMDAAHDADAAGEAGEVDEVDEVDEAALREEAELRRLEQELAALEQQVEQEEAAMAAVAEESREAEEELRQQRKERLSLEARLQQQERQEARQQGSCKLLQLQLTIAQQLNGVAASLTQVPAAEDRAWMPGALRSREQEVEALSTALRKQQQISQDAHRQLLELSTRRGAAAKGRHDAEALRTALAEQETARMAAEARADELQAQVELLEEQGLRLRLHKPPPLPRAAGPPLAPSASPPSKPSRIIIPSERPTEG